MAACVNRYVSLVRYNNYHTRFYHLFTKSRNTVICAEKQQPYMLKELCFKSMIGSEVSYRNITVTSALLKKARVNVTFVKHDGQRLTAPARVGDTLLDVVVNNDLDLKGYGACEGTLSCSTCHVIFKEEDFDKVEERATDEELDMLDLALDACSMSRLGCQCTVTKEMEGLEVKVPADVRDARIAPDTSESVTS